MKSLMNIRNESIFSFETLLECEPQTRLAKIFKVLDCNLVDYQLSKLFSRGPLGYKKANLLRALLAKCVYGIPNTAKLVERLSSDICLRYDCGFPLYDGIPSTATFCRFIQTISNTPSLQELFDSLVQKTFAAGMMNGTYVAIDADNEVLCRKMFRGDDVNVFNLDVLELIVALMEKMSIICIIVILYLHKDPHVIPQRNSSGTVFFCVLALVSMLCTIETQGLVMDIRTAPIILATLYLGTRDGFIVAVVTIMIRALMGGFGWMPWAIMAPLFVPMTLVLLRWLSPKKRSLGLSMIVAMNTLLSLVVFSLFANYFNDGMYKFYLQPATMLSIYGPMLLGNIISTIILDGIIRYIKQVENLHKSIAEAEIKYRNLVENSLVGVYILQKLKIVYANPALLTITGYTNEEILAVDQFYELVHPDYWHVLKGLLARSEMGIIQDVKQEIKLLAKNKDIRYVEVYGRKIVLDGNEVVIGTVVDITKRKQMEEKAQNEEEKYRLLFNSSNDAILVRPLKEAKGLSCFLEVNDKACEMFGYTRTEILAMSYHDLLHPTCMLDGDAIGEQLRTTGHALFEVTTITKDGKKIHAEINSHQFSLQGQPVVLSVCRNISERYQAEQALRESEERFRYMANNVPFMIWMADKNGQDIFHNQRWREYTGRTLEENLGEGWRESVHPDDQHRRQLKFSEILATRGKYTLEYRLRRFDGLYRWILSTGLPRYNPTGEFEGYIGCAIDIDDEKQHAVPCQQAYVDMERHVEGRTVQLSKTNEELKQEVAERKIAEDRYRMLFYSVQDGLLLWPMDDNGMPGKFMEVNDVTCQQLGYTRQELLALSPLEINSPKGQAIIPAAMKTLLEQGKVIFESEYIGKDGTIIPMEVNVSLFKMGGMNVGLAIVRDIRGRKKTEMDLLYARERNARTEKLAFLGGISAGIAHEINQPLNAIKVTADSILMWAKDGQPYDLAEFVEDVQIISRQAERAAGIVRYIRNIIQANQQINKKFFSIYDGVNTALKLMESQLSSSGVVVTAELDSHVPLVYGSSTHMEHVFINLINNALQAMEVMARSEKHIYLRTWFDQHIYIQITDNGTGISKDVLGKMFDAFFSTKSEGMGMGLSVVQSVISNHKGTIEVTNNKLGGATFIVKLPFVTMNEEKEVKCNEDFIGR